MTPRTTFHPVGRPAAPRRAGRAWLLVGLVAVAGLAAASALTVNQRHDTASLFAERYHIGEQVLVEGSTVAPAAAAAGALGVQGAPVEMARSLPVARTAVARDQWVYAVDVKEATPGAIAGGEFVVELHHDGVLVGRVHVAQATPEPDAVEGVRATFALGPELPASSLYYVQVRPFVPTGPVVEHTLRSHPSGDLTWQGVGGEHDGAVNPALTVQAGSTLRLTARNADGQVHNVGIKDAGGNLVDPPGWSPNLPAVGDERVIAWTPTAAGTYSYQCLYHAGTMRGTLTVVSA